MYSLTFRIRIMLP